MLQAAWHAETAAQKRDSSSRSSHEGSQRDALMTACRSARHAATSTSARGKPCERDEWAGTAAAGRRGRGQQATHEHAAPLAAAAPLALALSHLAVDERPRHAHARRLQPGAALRNLRLQGGPAVAQAAQLRLELGRVRHHGELRTRGNGGGHRVGGERRRRRAVLHRPASAGLHLGLAVSAPAALALGLGGRLGRGWSRVQTRWRGRTAQAAPNLPNRCLQSAGQCGERGPLSPCPFSRPSSCGTP